MDKARARRDAEFAWQEAEAAECQLKAARTDCDTAQQQRQDVESDLANAKRAHEDELRQMKSVLTDTQASVDEATEACHDAEQAAREASRLCGLAEQQRNTAVSHADRLRSELQAITTARDGLQSSRSELEDVKSKCNTLNQELSRARETAGEAQSARITTDARLAVVDAELFNTKNELAACKKQSNVTRGAIEKLERERDVIQTQHERDRRNLQGLVPNMES